MKITDQYMLEMSFKRIMKLKKRSSFIGRLNNKEYKGILKADKREIRFFVRKCKDMKLDPTKTFEKMSKEYK